MLATRIFPQTFRNFQNLLSRNQLIQQQLLNTTRNPFAQYHISNLFSLTNLISHQLSELQSEPVIKLLESFDSVERRFQNNLCKSIHTDISYNQNKLYFTLNHSFTLNKTLPLLQTLQEVKNSHQLKINNNNTQTQTNTSTQPNTPTQPHQSENELLQVQIKIQNCQQEKLDHPSVRNTLYFHQLKDLDQYIKYDFLPKTPIFIQDMNRKKLQMKVLDQKNPYGFPTKAPPLIFDIELNNKLYIRVKSTYEETNIVEVGSLKRSKAYQNQLKPTFKLSGMKLPRNVQKLIYEDILSSLLMIDDAEILKLHKLAYVGGRVQKLNILMDLHQTMQISNQDLFNKRMAALL